MSVVSSVKTLKSTTLIRQVSKPFSKWELKHFKKLSTDFTDMYVER